ncbi:MAG: redoxin domain-containing protein [Candidatus Hydrogenedentes bacterium]|nr:redoxin domain-containing protein [Candidatus Hydrogenedentota bacterium]
MKKAAVLFVLAVLVIAGADAQVAVLAEQYREQEAAILAIDSHYDTSPEELSAYAASRTLPFPVLKDAGNRYADRVGAKRTPEVFLVDGEGHLVHHGASDNRRFPGSPGSRPYTAEALSALLHGKPVPVQEARAWGCTTKRAA